jgi:hypothetical protein
VTIAIYAITLVLPKFNGELHYLLQRDDIKLINIITGMRYDRLLDNLDGIYLGVSRVKYFEMDLIDVYMSLGIIGVSLALVIYVNLLKLTGVGAHRLIIVSLIVYSLFFGHVVSSTSVGLIFVVLKLTDCNKAALHYN